MNRKQERLHSDRVAKHGFPFLGVTHGRFLVRVFNDPVDPRSIFGESLRRKSCRSASPTDTNNACYRNFEHKTVRLLSRTMSRVVAKEILTSHTNAGGHHSFPALSARLAGHNKLYESSAKTHPVCCRLFTPGYRAAVPQRQPSCCTHFLIGTAQQWVRPLSGVHPHSSSVLASGRRCGKLSSVPRDPSQSLLATATAPPLPRHGLPPSRCWL